MAWYDYPTNFSNGTSVTSLGSLVDYANYVTEGWFALAFLLVIFVITFVAGVAISSRKALLSSSFITFAFSVYFLRIEAIHPIIPFGLIVLMIAGALGSKAEGKY